MDEKADPVGLLQREDRLPERQHRYEEQPFQAGGEERPERADEQDGPGLELDRPAAEKAEEHDGPGEIRPLVNRMPARTTPQDGSICRAGSRSGMAATTIQSTAASRPIRAAVNWLTSVENVLLVSPSRAAARQFTPAAEDQKCLMLKTLKPGPAPVPDHHGQRTASCRR